MLKGVSFEQSNTILSLVSIAENSNTKWQSNYNYIEDIGDGRGYTSNIVGFCTGTGDFLWFVEDLCKLDHKHKLCKYISALKKVNGSSSHKGLKGLVNDVKHSNDSNYKKATWNAINHFYWGPVIEKAKKYNISYPISLGQMYDINLNMGSLKLVKPKGNQTESQWLYHLQKRWLNYITNKDHSLDDGQPDRALMWHSIRRNHNLTLPIKAQCYGDKFTIK